MTLLVTIAEDLSLSRSGWSATVGPTAGGGACAEGNITMPKYLFKARFTGEAIQAVMTAGGAARRAAADDLAKNLGGAVESYHFAFGDDDAYVICDLPDNKAAATLAMTVSSSGRVSVTTVALMTVEELDAIAAGPKLHYSPPGP